MFRRRVASLGNASSPLVSRTPLTSSSSAVSSLAGSSVASNSRTISTVASTHRTSIRNRIYSTRSKILTRKDPWRAIKGIDRINWSKDFAALDLEWHAIQRYAQITKILTGLMIMKREDIVGRYPVTVGAARFQFDKSRGSREDKTQAAHAVPRQILIADKPIAEWLEEAEVDEVIIGAMSGAEGVATVLPDYVNKADSLWELKGLAHAYQLAATDVITAPKLKPEDEPMHYLHLWKRFMHVSGSGLTSAIAHAEETGDDPRLAILLHYKELHGLAEDYPEQSEVNFRLMLEQQFRGTAEKSASGIEAELKENDEGAESQDQGASGGAG